MSDKPIYIIAPVPSLTALLRTTKIKALLEETGRPIIHLAWRRSPEEALNESPITTQVVLEGGGYKNASLAKWYLRYIFGVKKALYGAPRGSDVYALTFWSAIAPWMLHWVKGFRYFFDNNDNVALAYPWPRPVKPIVKFLEERIAARAKIHLIPGKSRWGRDEANLRVVANVPSSDIAAEARQIADQKGYRRGDVFTLYVNGWLTAERGLTATIGGLKAAPDANLRVIIAGRVDGGEGGDVTTMPRVEYLGKVSPAESLALYWSAHAVLTYYDPALPINRIAEANKWGDCIFTGTTFIVNDEVITAQGYRDADACFSVPFADHAALGALLSRLSKNPSEAVAKGDNLKSFASEPWDVMMNRVIGEWLGR